MKSTSEIVKKPLFWIIIWVLWISFPYWIFGKNSYLRTHDCAESNLSFRATTSQIYADYGFSAWIPNIACGIDSLTINTISYLTYDFILFIGLPPWAGYALIMFIQRFLATYFAYRLCKDFLGFNIYSSILAGIFWSLGTWTTNDWTLFDRLGPPLIPLYLYLLEVSLRSSGWKKYVLLSVTGLLLSYNSFFPLFTPFFIVGSFLWLLVVREYSIKILLRAFVFFGLFSLVLAIPQLVAIYFNSQFSGRMERMMVSISFKAAFLISSRGVVKYFLDYKVPWIITFIALFIARFKDKLLLRLVGTTIGAVLVSQILWLISVTNRDTLGFLSVINFNDFILIATFIPSVSAAYIIEYVSNSGKVLSIEQASTVAV